MELFNIPVKPYMMRLDKVGIFKYKKILVSLRAQCKKENVEIREEKIRWTILDPFKVRILITGVCPVPESELRPLRESYERQREILSTENKEKRKNKRKFL